MTNEPKNSTAKRFLRRGYFAQALMPLLHDGANHGFSLMTNEPKNSTAFAVLFFGVSAGARTRTESVGGSNGIQFHHGHIKNCRENGLKPRKMFRDQTIPVS